MQRIFIILLIACFAFAGCDQREKITSAIIFGTIKNNTEKYIILKNETITDTIKLGTHNIFQKQISIQSPEYFVLKYGDEIITIYLKPGDNIKLSCNAKNVHETIKFYGARTLENNLLTEKFNYNEKHPALIDFTGLNENSFNKKNDSVYNLNMEFIKRYKQENKESDAYFIHIEEAKCLYLWAETNIAYEAAYNSYLKKGNQNLSEKFKNKLKIINFNDSTLTDIFEYRAFIESYLNVEAGKLTNNFEAAGDLDFFNNKINILLKIVTDKKVRNRLFSDYFRDHIKIFGINGLEPLYTKFKKECSNQKFKAEVKSLYDKWTRIAPGNKAIDFSLPDINGKTYSLADFKGKFVYIDVWATWCAPCRREIPFMQKLHAAYKNNDTVLVSISIDESIDAWKKMSEIENPQWLQLHADNKSTILDDYLISSIPRFILIDNNGFIIDAQAPAASVKIKKLSPLRKVQKIFSSDFLPLIPEGKSLKISVPLKSPLGDLGVKRLFGVDSKLLLEKRKLRYSQFLK